MYQVNEDNSLYVTRGDIAVLAVTAEDNGKPYTFTAGDLLRIKVFEKKDCDKVVLQKDFPVTSAAETAEIFLDTNDTKIGKTINKPKDYWYEIELNPLSDPQTIIGYDEDGPKLFRLFPEGKDESADLPDIPSEEADGELDLSSERAVQNQVVARAVMRLEGELTALRERIAALEAESKEET